MRCKLNRMVEIVSIERGELGAPRYRQGHFVDQPQYSDWTEEMKIKADEAESHLVRPSPTGNAICFCYDPADAILIAESLNSADEYKQKYESLVAKYNRVCERLFDLTAFVDRCHQEIGELRSLSRYEL